MARTEGQMKAIARWQAEHMATMTVKMKKELRDEFKSTCNAQGVTANSVLLAAIRDFVEKHRDA